MHDFRQSLARSHDAEDYPFWEECYKKAFPTMKSMISLREDGEPQRAGIDRVIILADARIIYIDEKVRFRNAITGLVYEDIALERWSDFERRIPGWVVKPLLCDYIAYAIAPLGICYLLPVVQMQAAWKLHETEWETRKPIDAKNNGWTTRSYPVTARELYPIIGSLLRIGFERIESEEVA